jgi:hypothetical protein
MVGLRRGFRGCSTFHVQDKWSLESQGEGEGYYESDCTDEIVSSRTVNVLHQKMETARVFLHALGSLEAGLLDPWRIH